MCGDVSGMEIEMEHLSLPHALCCHRSVCLWVIVNTKIAGWSNEKAKIEAHEPVRALQEPEQRFRSAILFPKCGNPSTTNQSAGENKSFYRVCVSPMWAGNGCRGGHTEQLCSENLGLARGKAWHHSRQKTDEQKSSTLSIKWERYFWNHCRLRLHCGSCGFIGLRGW